MSTTTTRLRPAARAPLPKPLAPPRPRPRRSPAVSRPLDDTVPPAPARRHRALRGDLLLYTLLVVLVVLAWPLSRTAFVRAADPNYWIGVTGGSLLLLLFSYPLRKHVRILQRLGKVKWWFWLHLSLGISGAWVILVHSRFSIRSLNAGVALISLGIVVASGVVGRFIYVRVHRGLDGERTGLNELRLRAGFIESAARSRLHFAPAVEARLHAFEQRVLSANPGWATHLLRVTWLPLQRRLELESCMRELRKPLRELARRHQWRADERRRRRRRARRLLDRYLHAVVGVAQYSAYERLFALWHVAHLPFVYLLVISAVVHVVAVHAY